MSEKQKVLIVDDESRNQRIIAEILEDLVEYKNASSGEEALATIEAYFPDLVLLDIMMPGMDGYEVCKKIRAIPQMKFTKVILISGKAMLEERIKGYEIGADEYMAKPYAPEELLAKTKVFLRLAQTERELAILNSALEEKVKERTKQLLDAEAKLVTSAKMSALGEMAGGIAHEINTPLGTIGMIVDQIGDLVNEEPLDKEMILKMTQTAGATVQRIGGIITGLRTFSRDGSQDKFDVVPARQIIDETLVLCKEKLKNANVQLIIESVPADLKIHCRSVQISQVLINLISNACDAILPLSEKWIKIGASLQGDFVEVAVTDSGHGISEKIQDRIFQPFFTTKDIGKGTGLGLSVSKGIVDAHHGVLSVNAKCANTQFVLRLPQAEESTSPMTTPKKEVA